MYFTPGPTQKSSSVSSQEEVGAAQFESKIKL